MNENSLRFLKKKKNFFFKSAFRIAEINRISKENGQPEKPQNTSLRKRNKYIKKQPCKLLRTESLNTGRPNNKP